MVRIGIVGFPGVDDLDIVGVRSLLIKASEYPDLQKPLSVQVFGPYEMGEITCIGGCRISVDRDWAELHLCQAIVVPGGRVCQEYEVPTVLSKQLIQSVESGLPIYCVCSGVFLLGRLGLLSGRRVAVHQDKMEELLRVTSCIPASGLSNDGCIWTIGGNGGQAGIKSISVAMDILQRFSPESVPYVRRRMEIGQTRV